MLIPFDAPFLPDNDEDRLNSDGSRNLSGLILEIKHVDKPTEYEVLF